MPLGALAPLPLRLGGSAEEGFTAQQHSRLAADVMALRRSGVLVRLCYTKSGSTVTLDAYLDQNTVGTANPPTASVGGTGLVTWTFPRAWFDEFGDELPVKILGGDACKHGPAGGDATIVSHTANTVTVKSFDAAEAAADATVTLELYGTACQDSRKRADIGEYGGDPNKQDSKHEGEAPHAAAIFDSLLAARPDVYTRSVASYVGIEALAMARLLAVVCYRLPERAEANWLPGTAGSNLDYWLELLKIPAGNLPAWRLRQMAAAADRSAAVPTTSALRDVASTIFGSFFIRLEGSAGETPADEPYGTYWPGGITSPPSTLYPQSVNLGGGAWTSYRDRLVAVVHHPLDAEVADFRDASARWREAWDTMLPAYKTMRLLEEQSNLLILADAADPPADGQNAGLSDARAPEGPVLMNYEAL